MSGPGGAGDEGEKVHDPTPQKIRQAREKGDVPRSTDVTAAAAFLGLLVAVLAAGHGIVTGGAGPLLALIDSPDRLAGRMLGPGGRGVSAALFGGMAGAILPLFLVPMLLVVAALVAQQAVVVAPDKIVPKAARLSVIANAKQKFGPTGMVQFVKALVKLLTIAAGLAIYLSSQQDRFIGAIRAEPRMIAMFLAEAGVVLIGIATAIGIVIAAIDIGWQRFDHRRRLRMTHQELKEELKRSEGDPMLKAQRRSRGQQIALNQAMQMVPEADVVIVNPVHVAVALRWSRARGTAPVCLAKGEGALAERIREIAAEHGVPVHRDPPTARALLATVAIGQEIPVEQYRAVAAAIRFADRMRRRARDRGIAPGRGA